MISIDLPQQQLKRVGYELFIMAVSFLAILNSFLILSPFLSETEDQVLKVINAALALLFLADFLFRFIRAESRSDYLIRDLGWADLLSGIPLPNFQLFRVFRFVRGVYRIRTLGGRRTLKEATSNLANGALYVAVLLTLVLVEIASLSIVSIESVAPNANIKTAGDAIWWTYVTVTTVGYGDLYPVTAKGRLIGVLVMSVGVGLFGVLTGFLANAFLGRPRERQQEEFSDRTSKAVADEMEDSLNQLSVMQAMFEEQEKHFAHLREQMAAMELQLRQLDNRPPES